MHWTSFFAFLLLSSSYCPGQITGSKLLEKAIDYHDPDRQWQYFSGVFEIELEMPDKTTRISKFSLDLPNSFFKLDVLSNNNHSTYKLTADKCEITRNGNNDFTVEEISKYRLTCDQANLMKDYYTYLYGLPMKLKDKGTIIHEKVEHRTFKGKMYYVLKVTYDVLVGSDTWYFYFDPTTSAMEVYQFFHDESISDGEYIVLSELEIFKNMKIPKNRTWYYNKDDKNIGEDKLVRITELTK